jgi:hypothetical protein
LQFFVKKIKIKISSCKFCSILGHQTRIRDPDPESGSAIRKNAGSGSATQVAAVVVAGKTVVAAPRQVL